MDVIGDERRSDSECEEKGEEKLYKEIDHEKMGVQAGEYAGWNPESLNESYVHAGIN
jgi:hypothetical protein